jgi:hypothetical protein
MSVRQSIHAWPARAVLTVALAGLFILTVGVAGAGATSITPHGTATLTWEANDLASLQLANNVMVMPIAPVAFTPVAGTIKLGFPIVGGSFLTALPYWGPVYLGGGIRFLKLSPGPTWTQVTVTKLAFNIKTQAVTASINGGPRVVFADVNEMGMTDHRFWSHGHLYVRIRNALLFYSAAATTALQSAFGYVVPAMEPVGSLTEVVRLK